MTAALPALFGALADPTRLSIVRELAAEHDVCACAFDVCAELAQPTVSHHLHVLREAGIVSAERRGTYVHYALESGALELLRAFLESIDHAERTPARSCCQGS